MCKKFEINILRNGGDNTSFNFLSHIAHTYSTKFITTTHRFVVLLNRNACIKCQLKVTRNLSVYITASYTMAVT